MATISHSKMQLENLAHSETCDSLLLREMHHRMADTLTLLVGALWNEFGSSTTPGFATHWLDVKRELSLLAVCIGY